MQLDPAVLLSKIRAGDRAALARAITLAESTRAQDRDLVMDLLDRCLPHTGRSLRLGLTGIPGVGKSTLIDALGLHLIGQGHRVAVLAVDPSSQRSGGSILGDKTRMERLSMEPDAFIRPSPTGGTLGGVTSHTREAILLCEAAGHDRILIETVGVGQSEHEVDTMTDLNVLLMISGAGDELQGIKRGIMESADVIVFTKADGDAAARASAAATELKNALALLPARDSGRHPRIILTSASTGQGIGELAEELQRLEQEDAESGRTTARRRQQALRWMRQAVAEGLLRRFNEDPTMAHMRIGLETEVTQGERSPLEAARLLLEKFLPPQ